METSIKLSKIDDSFSKLRLTRPEQIKSMQNSLEITGQLQPVFVRHAADLYQLLDGFKRYYACLQLKWDEIRVHIVDLDDITAKAMILNYNQYGSSLVDYEEAQIVYSLKKEHLMKHEEIATLLTRSFSWVSRRLSFIERLSPTVQSHLQLGKISPSHARELVKLPRGKQDSILKLIVDNKLTSRETSVLVFKYLQSQTQAEQDYLLSNPLDVINQSGKEDEIKDCRLSPHGNRLLKTTRLLLSQQHIFIGQTSNPPICNLKDIELKVLSTYFADVLRKTTTIQSIIKQIQTK